MISCRAFDSYSSVLSKTSSLLVASSAAISMCSIAFAVLLSVLDCFGCRDALTANASICLMCIWSTSFSVGGGYLSSSSYSPRMLPSCLKCSFDRSSLKNSRMADLRSASPSPAWTASQSLPWSLTNFSRLTCCSALSWLVLSSASIWFFSLKSAFNYSRIFF